MIQHGMYKNRRNVVGDDGSYISIQSMKLPKHPYVDIYNKFNSDNDINYLELTESTIQGTGNFVLQL
jgi:secreted protein with Ig-like and vWFA domain